MELIAFVSILALSLGIAAAAVGLVLLTLFFIMHRAAVPAGSLAPLR